METDDTLAARFLSVIGLSQVGKDMLLRISLSVNALNHGVIGVRLAALGLPIASEKHSGLPLTHDEWERLSNQ
jgi:hypothetical protein